MALLLCSAIRIGHAYLSRDTTPTTPEAAQANLQKNGRTTFGVEMVTCIYVIFNPLEAADRKSVV